MPGVALIVRHRYPSLVVMARAVPPSRPPPGAGRCPPSCCLSVLRSKQACSTTPTLTTAAGFTYDAGIRTPVSGTRTRPATLAAAGCGGRAITLGAPSARRCGSFGSQSARPHSLFEHSSPWFLTRSRSQQIRLVADPHNRSISAALDSDSGTVPPSTLSPGRQASLAPSARFRRSRHGIRIHA